MKPIKRFLLLVTVTILIIYSAYFISAKLAEDVDKIGLWMIVIMCGFGLFVCAVAMVYEALFQSGGFVPPASYCKPCYKKRVSEMKITDNRDTRTIMQLLEPYPDCAKCHGIPLSDVFCKGEL